MHEIWALVNEMSPYLLLGFAFIKGDITDEAVIKAITDIGYEAKRQ